jgi:hypothetical protein
MAFKNWQLVAIVVGTFAAVIALDIFVNYKDQVDFANGFPKLNTAMFAKSRVKQMIEQEHNVVPVGNTAPPTFAEEEEETSEDS